MAPKQYSKKWPHWSWKKTMHFEGVVSKQEHDIKINCQSNAINLKQPSSLPPNSSNFYKKEEKKIKHIANFRGKWRLEINKVCNWMKNWPQKHYWLSKRFRDCTDLTLGNCWTKAWMSTQWWGRTVELSKARRGEDNAFSKQTKGSRRTLLVLRTYLINCKRGEPLTLPATDLNLPTQFIFITTQYWK